MRGEGNMRPPVGLLGFADRRREVVVAVPISSTGQGICEGVCEPGTMEGPQWHWARKNSR